MEAKEMISEIKEKDNRYRIVCLKKDEDFILKTLNELKGTVIYFYDKGMFLNIIYDTLISEELINEYIAKYMNYLATFELYQKKYD